MTGTLEVVGALIKDDRDRVYVHRRTADRRLFPGIWDIVGGHVEPGESAEEALAREIEEETGWRLRRIEGVAADWEWAVDSVVRRETDYLVEVDGDLTAPRLERPPSGRCPNRRARQTPHSAQQESPAAHRSVPGPGGRDVLGPPPRRLSRHAATGRHDPAP